MTTTFRPMLAGDLLLLDLQHTQLAELEAFGSPEMLEKARDLADGGEAWTATHGGRIVACGGFREDYAHSATAWVAIAIDVPIAAGVAIARHGRRAAIASRYDRLEALVDPRLDKAVDFVEAVGLKLVAALGRKGIGGETMLLYERVR